MTDIVKEPPVLLDEARLWLDGYKHAWETRDVELASALFSDDATYREGRFMPAMVGANAIRNYWQSRVYEGQRDVSFSYKIWAVSENQCFAEYQANFTWLPINGIMELDGVLRVTFRRGRRRALICSMLEEWIDMRDG